MDAKSKLVRRPVLSKLTRQQHMLEGVPHLEALLFAKHAHCMAVMYSEGVKACGKC